jgi:hypothetical protein
VKREADVYGASEQRAGEEHLENRRNPKYGIQFLTVVFLLHSLLDFPTIRIVILKNSSDEV